MIGREDAQAGSAHAPAAQALDEAVRWFREDSSRLECLDSATALAIDLRHAAAIVRAALAAGPDGWYRELMFLREHADTLQDSIERAWSAIPDSVDGEDDSLASHIVAALASARPAAEPDDHASVSLDESTHELTVTCKCGATETVGAGDHRAARAWWDQHAAARSAGDATTETVSLPRELLDSLVDGDDCWFDHHGGCQAHGYLSLEPGELCPQADLKQRLTRTETPWKAEQS